MMLKPFKVEKATNHFWRLAKSINEKSDNGIRFSEAIHKLELIIASANPRKTLHHRANVLKKTLWMGYEGHVESDCEAGNWFMDRPVNQNSHDNENNAPLKQQYKSNVRLDPAVFKDIQSILGRIAGRNVTEREFMGKVCWWIDGKDIILTTDFLYADGTKVTFSITRGGPMCEDIGFWVETMRGETA